MLLFLDFSGGEFLLVGVVFLMFFGSKSIPDIARTLGKTVRDFKEAANSIQRDIQESSGLNQIKEELNLSPNKTTPPQPQVKLPEVIPSRPEEPKKEDTQN